MLSVGPRIIIKGGSAVLTTFGRLVRKLRIDKGLLLGDMADALKVSASFLSAVETGKKSVPSDWPTRITSWLGLDTSLANELHEAALESLKEVHLPLGGTSQDARNLAVTFAKQFQSLTPEDREKMMTILNSGRESAQRNAEVSK